jgi:adenylate kinase family enzyme
MHTGSSADRSLSETVTALSDTIRACERLCLLTSRTVSRCAVSLDENEADKAPLAFIPSVSRDLQNILPSISAGTRAPSNPHPTTAAHCITALQSLLPVMGRFQLGTHESKGLAFHPIERESLEVFKPKTLSSEIRNTIERSLIGLDWPAQAQTSAAEEAASTAGGHTQRSGTTFRPLHPFRASQTLRALAPSRALFQPIAWRSLFTVLWFLNRRGGSLRGYLSIQATDSPGTAFLTSKCVEAIEIVLNVFERRRERFKRLLDLMTELRRIVTAQEELEKLEKAGLIQAPLFHHGYRYRTSLLIPEIKMCIAELACDSALPETYQTWKAHLVPSESSITEPVSDPDNGLSHDKYGEHFKTAENFLHEVVDRFCATLRDERAPSQTAEDAVVPVSQEFQNAIAAANAAGQTTKCMAGIVKRIHQLIQRRCEELNSSGRSEKAPAALAASENEQEELLTSAHLRSLPKWICSEDYWAATKWALGLEVKEKQPVPPESQAILNALELHWARHRDAADNASKTIQAFTAYLVTILDGFKSLARNITSESGLGSVDKFLESSGDATNRLTALRKQLSNDLDRGVRWAEVVMNRHLSYAASGATAQFDASELAHAVRVTYRDGGRVRFTLILEALKLVCAAQRPDGTWSCQQPFYWRETGYALLTMSIETAAAIVSTVYMLVTNPDRYGAGLAEVTSGLEPVYQALDRFFGWLSGSIQSFDAPPALLRASDLARRPKPATAARPAKGGNANVKATSITSSKPETGDNARTEPPLYGWCSDRLSESDRIHSWATATAIEFLVDFRRLIQVRINALLRAEFLSHHPSELTRLSDVEPTDLRSVLGRDDDAPVIARLMRLLREHKKLEIAEGPWVSSKPDDAKLTFWSALLYGPPGTSKSFLAKAIAGELGWPLISVSPSDFLAKGDNHIEPRAQEIFSAFSAGSRIVFFFDEIDELIRDRRQQKDQRSALSFLTPSFLTKLQEFRDAAAKNEFIFILATNYKDNIDSAAIRSGRIDQHLPIIYPDIRSRAYIVIRELTKRSKKKENVADQFEYVSKYLRLIKPELDPLLKKLKKESGNTNAKFLDVLAEFSGFLSYQKIQALLELLPDFEKHYPNVQEDLQRLVKALSTIGQRNTGRFQPEIPLVEYAGRPDTFEDELTHLTEIIPHRIFPWHPKAGSSKSLLQSQLKELYGEIEKKNRKAFRDAFDGLYKKNRWRKPWN